MGACPEVPLELAVARVQPEPGDVVQPRFQVDPFWARELPNDWILGQVSGIDVDEADHVWVLHRPETLDAIHKGNEERARVG